MPNPDKKKAFNPSLATTPAFQTWYNKNTVEGKSGQPYSDNGDYDYLSFFMNGDYKNYKGGHFPDTYKRPNHETFSNESIYSIPENPGGQWNGDTYNPNGTYMRANGGKTGKAVAVSYDLYGNPVNVPQNQFDYNAQFQQPTDNYNLNVGNGQWVNQGLNTGSNQYVPQPQAYMQPQQDSQAYMQNPDGSFAINTNYINTNLTGGVRGYDAYGNYNQNTNRSYGYEGLYGTQSGQGNMMFMDGGEISPNKAAEILKDGTINGKKITDKQRKFFGAMSNKANGGTIEIKPSREGKFTDWASQRGMSVSQATSKVLGNPGQYSTEVEKMAQFARNIGKADDGASFNNPFIPWTNQYPYQQPPAQMQSAPYQQLPVQQQMQGQQINVPQYQSQDMGDQGYGSTSSGIQSGVSALGSVFSGINNLRNQVILGGGALINGLLPDHHNIRQRSPVMADQTLAYQPQFNNMLENGGMLKMGDGGTIQVDSKNDPKYRVYQQATANQNKRNQQIEELKNHLHTKNTKIVERPLSGFHDTDIVNIRRKQDPDLYGAPTNKYIGIQTYEDNGKEDINNSSAWYPVYPQQDIQKVSVRPPLQPLPVQQFGETPQGNMQGTPISWDNVTNNGVFPVYGQNNQLQGSWDKDKSGNIQYYPVQGQDNIIPNGLPSNTQVNPYPATRIQNIHFENGGNMQQQGPVVNTAYQPNQVVDLTPEEVANLKKAGYKFEILG